MDNAVGKGNKIHFDLSNMSNIDDVLKGVGQYANKTTSFELRYLKNNWDYFKDSTIFYNKGKIVQPPWIK